jgi:predicted Zn-dependent protease
MNSRTGPKLFRLLVPAAALALLFVGACDQLAAPPEGSGEGPGHRAQQLGLPPEQEYELGVQAYQKVLRDNRGHILPATDPRVTKVRAIASKIVRAAGIEPLQREINLHLKGYRFDWEVNVIDSRQVNAFCLPGGKIVVYTGILPVAKNDDQLATVLSHEIAHALAHHSNERITRSESGRVTGIQEKAYDRAQESEADHIGLFLMTFAGYDPDEAVRFWERMAQLHQGADRPPEFLSDHPSDERRVADMRKWAPMAKKAKQQFDAGHYKHAPDESR